MSSSLEGAKHVAERLVGRLGDVDADVDVGDGRGEAHDDPDRVHHPRRGGERQQEPRAAYLVELRAKCKI